MKLAKGIAAGEAREVAVLHAALAREVKTRGLPWPTPVALISGGECTVTVKGNGRGGSCGAFPPGVGRAPADTAGVPAIALENVCICGREDNAGAIAAPDSLARAAALGINASQRLSNNDGYGFFSALGDLVVTGPTRTNVNDFRAVYIA